MSSKSDIVKITKKTSEQTVSRASSLRQKVLTKATTSLPKETTPPLTTYETPQKLKNIAEFSITHLEKDPCASDSDAETSSVGSTASTTRRVSLLYASPRKGTGVEMDMVSGVANTLLRQGIEALETATNMKRECKTTAHESLQGLYETVLSLSDSRNRHRCNLEKERSRHAQELVHIERAHAKQLQTLHNNLTEQMHLARTEVTDTLKEAQAVRSWLGYETMEPFREIKKIWETQETIINDIKDVKAHMRAQKPGSETDSPQWKVLESVLSNVERQVNSLGPRLDSLRRDMDKTMALVTDAAKQASEARPPTPAPQHIDRQEEHLQTLREAIEEIKKLHSTPLSSPPPPPPPPHADLTQEFKDISEKLEIVSSEMRALKEIGTKRTNSPARPSLDTELAVQEVKQTLATIKKGVSELTSQEKPQAGPHTFAQVAAIPKQPHPNHTLIISSKIKTETSENVITKIRDALDLRKSGAKVDRVRKARDQKVVLRCPSKEDMNSIKSQVQMHKDLTVKEPASLDPLVCVRGVLSCFTNDEIVEHTRSQNQHLLHNLSEAEMRMRVRYRKRARNPHECHPVLELSPPVWKRFTEAGKIYVGFGRCTVEDQSPLVQCAKCLGFGHTKTHCKAVKDTCSYCGGEHTGKDCPLRLKLDPPRCVNCTRAGRDTPDQVHTAYSAECLERQKWDSIARTRVQYC